MKGRLKLVLSMLFLCNCIVFSQGYYNEAIRLSFPGISSGARSLGMGNSYISISDDINGIIYNPAGLATADNFQFSGSFMNDSYSGSSTYKKSRSNYSNSAAKLSQAGLVFPVHTDKLNFAIGLSFNQTNDIRSGIKFDGYNRESSYINYLFEMGNEIPADVYLDNPRSGSEEPISKISKNVNQSGYITESGRINKWSLAAAFEVGEGLFLGGTINIIKGNYRSNKQIYEDDIYDSYDVYNQINFFEPESYDFQRFSFRQLNDRSISGWDVKVGLLYKNPKNWQIGAYVKFPTQLSVEEDLYYSASSQFYELYKYTSSLYENIKYDISTPFELGLGISYEYSGLTVSADVNYIDYSSLELEKSDDNSGKIADLQTLERSNMYIEEMFRGVVNYNLGVEYLLPNHPLALRAGFIMQPTMYDYTNSKNKYENVSDFNKKYLTAGISLDPGDRIVIDMAYAHGMWDENGDNYDIYFASATQEVTRDYFVFSLKYKLDSQFILDKLL